MEKEKDLKKEISAIAIRIMELVVKYKKEEYTPIVEDIKNQVFSHLINANTVLSQKNLYSEILNLDSNYENNLPQRNDELSIIFSIRAAVSICKNHYSYNFIEDVKKIIDYIGHNREYTDSIKRSINIVNYIESSKEYDKVKDLMFCIYEVEDLWNYDFKNLLELYGLCDILLSVENEIKIIHCIEDKNLKNAVIDYISEYIDFKKFVFEE